MNEENETFLKLCVYFGSISSTCVAADISRNELIWEHTVYKARMSFFKSIV